MNNGDDIFTLNFSFSFNNLEVITWLLTISFFFQLFCLSMIYVKEYISIFYYIIRTLNSDCLFESSIFSLIVLRLLLTFAQCKDKIAVSRYEINQDRSLFFFVFLFYLFKSIFCLVSEGRN
jgi:hypothetical protein